MKQDIEAIIERAAKAAANEVVRAQRRKRQDDLYSVTEKLLRAYPKLLATVSNPSEYGFVPPDKSKDISVAPPKGAGVKDKMEIQLDAINERKRSFERTAGQFAEINAAIKPYIGNADFKVIRMYYWNEDFDGKPRDGKRYTFEEIADEYSMHGEEKSVKTLRKTRTRLVKDITVLMFGIDGAISIEHRKDESAENE